MYLDRSTFLFICLNMSSPRPSRVESELIRRLSTLKLSSLSLSPTPLSPTSYRMIHTASPCHKICPPAPRATRASSPSFCWSHVSYLQPGSKIQS